MAIDLIKRSETSSPLTATQFDQNMTTLETAVSDAQTTLNAHGTQIAAKADDSTTTTALAARPTTAEMNAAIAAANSSGESSPATPFQRYDYYVDSVDGSDANPGVSPIAPLLTAARANVLAAGASKSVGFKYGSVFNEILPQPANGADAAHPTRYGAYGDPADGLPTFKKTALVTGWTAYAVSMPVANVTSSLMQGGVIPPDFVDTSPSGRAGTFNYNLTSSTLTGGTPAGWGAKAIRCTVTTDQVCELNAKGRAYRGKNTLYGRADFVWHGGTDLEAVAFRGSYIFYLHLGGSSIRGSITSTNTSGGYRLSFDTNPFISGMTSLSSSTAGNGSAFFTIVKETAYTLTWEFNSAKRYFKAWCNGTLCVWFSDIAPDYQTLSDNTGTSNGGGIEFGCGIATTAAAARGCSITWGAFEVSSRRAIASRGETYTSGMWQATLAAQATLAGFLGSRTSIDQCYDATNRSYSWLYADRPARIGGPDELCHDTAASKLYLERTTAPVSVEVPTGSTPLLSWTSATNVAISNLRFWLGRTYGAQWTAPDGVAISDCEFAWCGVRGWDMIGQIGAAAGKIKNIRFERNLVHHNRCQGGSIYAAVTGTVLAGEFKFFDNIVAYNGIASDEDPTDDTRGFLNGTKFIINTTSVTFSGSITLNSRRNRHLYNGRAFADRGFSIGSVGYWLDYWQLPAVLADEIIAYNGGPGLMLEGPMNLVTHTFKDMTVVGNGQRSTGNGSCGVFVFRGYRATGGSAFSFTRCAMIDNHGHGVNYIAVTGNDGDGVSQQVGGGTLTDCILHKGTRGAGALRVQLGGTTLPAFTNVVLGPDADDMIRWTTGTSPSTGYSTRAATLAAAETLAAQGAGYFSAIQGAVGVTVARPSFDLLIADASPVVGAASDGGSIMPRRDGLPGQVSL